MLPRCLAVVVLASCATAREAPPDSDNPRGSGAALTDAATDYTTDAAPHDAASVTQDAPADSAGSSSSCTQPYSGVLATWSFTGAAGSQASTIAATSAPGVTAGAVSRVGVTASAGANSINSSSWTTQAQLDPGKYYTFTITPPAGCTLTLTSAGIDGRASATGPTAAAIAASADAFAQTAPVSTTAASTPALSVTDATSAVELRIYGYAASSASGTFRLQNSLTLSGSVQ